MVVVNVDPRALLRVLDDAGYDLYALAALDRRAGLPENTTIGIITKAADDPEARFSMSDLAKIALAIGTPLSSISPDHADFIANHPDASASLAADSSTIDYTRDPDENNTDSHTQI